MTLVYGVKKVSQTVLRDASCDRCNENLSVDEGKLEDAGIFRHSFSWRNPEYPCGDMVTVICEKCILEIFHFAKFTGDPC